MGAEIAILVILLIISIIINVAFCGYLRESAEYKRVTHDEETPKRVTVEVPKVPEKKPESEVVVEKKSVETEKPKKKAENETEAEQKKTTSAPPRSTENDLRSEHNPMQREPQQRSDRQRLHEPVGRHEFARYMHLVIQFVNDYFDESHKHPVLPEHPVSFSRLSVDPPEKNEEIDSILKDVTEIIVPNICHTQHPRFHAKFCGKSLADIIGMIISQTLCNDVFFSSINEKIENILCKWFTRSLGLPQFKREKDSKGASGLHDAIGTVCYSSVDSYTSVIRHAKKKHEANKQNTSNSQKPNEFVVYCSDDSHLPLNEACTLEKVKLRKVPTFDKNMCGMTASCLQKQIDKDVQRAFVPLMVVSNYGSANVAATDELWDIVNITKQKRIWLHLDATYAGCKWIDPNFRNNVHGLISKTNSIHIELSSLLPYSGNISMIWSDEKIKPPATKQRNCENPIRLWVLLRLYGIRSIRETVRRKVVFGNAFADRLAHHSELFEVFYVNDHGVTIFQYNNKRLTPRHENVNKITSMFYNYLVTSSTFKFSLFTFHGKILIKAVVNYEKCHNSMLQESISTLLNSAEEFEESLKKDKLSLKEAPEEEFCEMIGGSPNATTEDTQSGEISP